MTRKHKVITTQSSQIAQDINPKLKKNQSHQVKGYTLKCIFQQGNSEQLG